MYTVLCISCHPDDMEISCGGTLLKCLKRGDDVTVCHVANGDMGHVVIMPEELRLIRAAEAQNAGKLGGLKVVTENGWFAARPSGTEAIYKIYMESFKGEEHLDLIQKEAVEIVSAALKKAGV